MNHLGGRRVVRLMAALLGVVTLLCGCGGLTLGASESMPSPAPEQLSPVPLYEDEVPSVAFLARARGWDLCAVHDPVAAAAVTKARPAAIVPKQRPGRCELELDEPDSDLSAWILALELAEHPTSGGSGIAVDGTQLAEGERYGDRSCIYSLPVGSTIGQEWGIHISASSFEPTRPACEIAAEYAAVVVPKLAEPPRRDAGLTAPALSVASLDPCAVVAAVVERIPEAAPKLAAAPKVMSKGGGWDGPVHPVGQLTGPYDCGLDIPVRDTPPFEFAFNVQAQLTVESIPLKESGEVSTIAGRPAHVNDLGSGSCAVTFQVSDLEIVTDSDGGYVYEAATIDGPCERSEELVEATVQVVADAQPPAPAPSAVTLGRIDL